MDFELKKQSKKTKSRYEKCDKLGEGTYGVVYKGIDTQTDKIVAIKKMKLEN